MRALWSRFSIEWCRTFHSKTCWPTHGHYSCPACFRIYPVPWQEGDEFARRETAGDGDGRQRFVVFAFQKDRS